MNGANDARGGELGGGRPPPRAALAPTTTSRRPYAGHHIAPPLCKSLKKTVTEVIHIVPADGEGEESSWYLEAGKVGECSWPLLLTRQIKVVVLPLLQIEVGLQLLHLKAMKICKMSSERNC
jgi:hypothetical protein